MDCAYCKSPTKVVNSRGAKRFRSSKWRRRSCTKCGALFSTREQPILDTVIFVRSDDDFKPLTRAYIAIELYEALKKRQDTVNILDDLVDTTLNGILAIGEADLTEIEVKRQILSTLQNFDHESALQYSINSGLFRMPNIRTEKLLDELSSNE
ncbi:MAG: hypothetical protein AAF413_04440 [Patescibacteria group bacterium]